MKFQTIFTLIIFLYLSVYVPSIEEYEIHNLGEVYSWDQAMEACENKSGNLPEVQTIMIGSGFTDLRLVNRELENSTDCFWLKANYERVDNLTDDSYPGRCCEVLFKDRDGTFNTNCIPCNLRYRYLCASGNNTVFRVLFDNIPWLTAAQNCSTHAHGLPSDSNKGLLTHMPLLEYIWVNGVRRLNLNPKRETGNNESSRFDIYTMTATSSIAGIITSGAVTNRRNSTDAPVLKESLADNRALIGGVAGAGVVLIIIIIIVVVFMLRRSKKTENEGSNSKGPGNCDRFVKGKMYVNTAYTDVDSEYSGRNKYASIQIQNVEKELTTYYSVPNKEEGSSEVTRDKYSVVRTNEEQSRTAVYSVVRSGPNTVENLNNMKQNTAEEYDKANIGTYNQGEHSRDVYDKTNFHHKPRDEHFENVYNKANFNLEPKDTVDVNVYDKADLHSEHQIELSGNEYAKSTFHREPRDEHTGNVYDNV